MGFGCHSSMLGLRGWPTVSILGRFLSQQPAPGGGMERRTLQSSSFAPPPAVGVIDDFVGVHRAMANMTVFACVRLLADTIASLPWKAYRRDSQGVPKEVKPQPAIISQPYPGFDLFEWKWMTVASMALRGNAYSYIAERDKNGYPTALLPLHPDIVFLEYQPDLLKWFEPIYRIMGEAVDRRDMVHMRRFTMPGEPWGMSPIRQAAVAIGLGLSAEEYGYRFYKESATPSGTLSTEQDLDPDAITTLQQNWIQSHGGRRLPAILTKGFKFEPISLRPNESQFLETRQFQRSEICLLYGVPPILIGDTKETTAWGCLPSSALVFTLDGPVPIVNIKKGDEVWSFDGQQIAPSKVTGWTMTGYKRLLTIKTTGRELQVTANHRIPVRRYFGVADGRSAGNPHRKGTCGWETLEVSAGEVRPGDYLIVPHEIGGCSKRRVTSDGQDLSVGRMEFAGLYLGDGNRDKGRVEIAHGHGRDEDHMAHYRQVIEHEFGVVPYTDDRGTRTRFSSPEAISLVESGFTGNASTKRLPGWVFRLAPELQLALLRGYLDADGSVQAGNISYSSVNKLLLEDVRHLCIQLGIPVGTVKLGRKAGPMMIRGKVYQSKDKWELSLNSKTHNVRIGSNSAHKAVRLSVPVMQRRMRYDEDWTGVSYGNRKPIGKPPTGTVYHKVVSIEHGETEVPVYDIEVAGMAHYIADGIVVHNTGVSQITLGAVTYTFRPWTSLIESIISAQLPRGQFVRFDYNALLRGDVSARYETLKTGIQSTLLTPNEARASEEMDPVENGDQLLVPPNYLPLGAQVVAAMGGGSMPSVGKTPPKKPKTPGTLPMPPVGGGENHGSEGNAQNGHRSGLEEPFARYRQELRAASREYGKTGETLISEECDDVD